MGNVTEESISKEQVVIWREQAAKMREKLFGGKHKERKPGEGKKLAADILTEYFDLPSHSVPLTDDARKKMNEVMSHLRNKKK
jgi:hypothetical protein